MTLNERIKLYMLANDGKRTRLQMWTKFRASFIHKTAMTTYLDKQPFLIRQGNTYYLT